MIFGQLILCECRNAYTSISEKQKNNNCFFFFFRYTLNVIDENQTGQLSFVTGNILDNI